jgi:hypothetical protein
LTEERFFTAVPEEALVDFRLFVAPKPEAARKATAKTKIVMRKKLARKRCIKNPSD